MSYIICDVEADGEYPLDYSMVCFGACVVREGLKDTFYGETFPISERYNEAALSISGFSRAQHLQFDDPIEVMKKFANWIDKVTVGKPIFMSDNLAFDWMWINTYLHKFAGRNPFGYSGRRIGDLWCGYKNDLFLRWKWMRETTHDHNPVNDARGNAEALMKMQKQGLKISFK